MRRSAQSDLQDGGRWDVPVGGMGTVTDAVRSAHWRVVAVERRQSWYEQAGDGARL